jgi:hypothetical protein
MYKKASPVETMAKAYVDALRLWVKTKGIKILNYDNQMAYSKRPDPLDDILPVSNFFLEWVLEEINHPGEGEIPFSRISFEVRGNKVFAVGEFLNDGVTMSWARISNKALTFVPATDAAILVRIANTLLSRNEP